MIWFGIDKSIDLQKARNKYLSDEIVKLELGTGVPIVYDLDAAERWYAEAFGYERDLALRHLIPRAIDDAHPTRAELAADDEAIIGARFELGVPHRRS